MKTDNLPDKPLKVALVCDWLTGIGGAERVVLELHKMFPTAPIYTSQYDPAKIDWFNNADVRTTWLQKLPTSLKKFLPVLRAWSFSHLDLRDYDLVISESGAEAKAVRFGPQTIHVCICNTPTHYYWRRYEQYLKEPGVGIFNPLARLGLRLLVGSMRKWDYQAAQRPTHMVAISMHIQKDIAKFYHRDSTVIHPPVDTERFLAQSPRQRHGLVIAGRQTPYKRIDLAIAACTKLGLPLTVIGDGPDHNRLVQLAGPTITFVTNADDGQVTEYFCGAEGFIFPGLDDFGITPVEAMAAGTPVIAYQAGGALDYVVPGKTGLFFPEQTVKSLTTVLQNFNPSSFNPTTIQTHAQSFSNAAFQTKIQAFLAAQPPQDKK